ncbi:MAG: baseplate J/gp47 family protein [Verrucomicrobia bacterium]|nr:baseplate J/gp47 family protein [Verrucomicrobiota bacterium]
MAEIINSNGNQVTDHMARDYDSFLRAMRDLIPTKLPEWKEFESEADFGNVLLQLFAHMGDILSYYQDRVANESFLGTAQTRRSIIHHLRLIGYKLSTAAPASATLILTVPATCNEIITISKGDAFATKSQKDKPSVRFEYTLEVPRSIDCSILSIDPTTNKKFYVGIPMEEGRLIENEILGTSNGTPNQKFPLAHSDIIFRSLDLGQGINKDIILLTQLGETIEVWRLQESLAFSRESQRDFVIELDEDDRATVTFGDGSFGAIPPSGAVIKATYRVGGGEHGNVAANSIQTIVDAPQLALLSAQITNPEPATGGADRESIGHAVLHSPKVFRSLRRAVTAEDYEALALNFKGVGKVRAEAINWNTVNLFVAPEGGGRVSDVLEANLLAYFEDKRPVSTIIEIEDVDYVKIFVTAEVGVQSFYSQEEIKKRVEEAAGKLLAFDNVDFGQTLYLSKFFEAIEAIEGVEFVNIMEFRREEQQTGYFEPSGKIELEINEVPRIPDAPDDGPAYAGGIKVLLEGGT